MKRRMLAAISLSFSSTLFAAPPDGFGLDCVGIGSDFDGIPTTPEGLDGVDKYPALIAELARRGWADDALAKVAGGSIQRVLCEAEAVAKRLQATELASTATIEALDVATKK